MSDSVMPSAVVQQQQPQPSTAATQLAAAQAGISINPLSPPPPAAAAATTPQAAAAATPAAAGLPPLAPPSTAAPPPPPAGAAAAAAASTPSATTPDATAAAAAAAPGSTAAAAASSRFDKCGFAKLLGDNGLEYYVKKYEIILGRKSKASNLDVVLGDSPVLSRQHARIVYNFQAGRWELHVEGKNGITVNGALYTPTTGPCILNSQDLLQAGDHNFYFLLPKQQRKRAPKASKAATPTASESGPPQQQQQQQQQVSSAGSPRLGGPSPTQQQPAAAAAALGPALDGPQLGGGLANHGVTGGPGMHPTTGFSSGGGNALNLQQYSSGPLLPGMTSFGNGTGSYNGGDLMHQRSWGSGFSNEAGVSGGLGVTGEEPRGLVDMDD